MNIGSDRDDPTEDRSGGSDSAPRFINGVLGTLAEQIDALRAELGAVEEKAVSLAAN